jgi:hypothetical protein
MIQEDILKDITCASDFLHSHSDSIVAVRNQTVIGTKQGDGIRPFLELMNDMKDQLSECVIGDRILGKASALLCCYVHARGMYAPQGTKTAIAALVVHGIPAQVDSMVPHIMNRTGDGLCPFERLLESVDDPSEAYRLITEKLDI